MDNTTLYEQVVRRERTPKHGLTVALIVLGVIGVPAIIFAISIVAKIPYLNIVALFIFALAIYFGWYLITSLNVEYEYAFLSSTLRVDKVIAKRRRKKVVKLDVKRLDDFFPYSDKEMTERHFTKVYHCGSKEFSDSNYVAAFHDEEKGKCALVFAPNEAFLEGMKPYFNADIRKKLFFAQKK